jgi:hypothetical protein
MVIFIWESLWMDKNMDQASGNSPKLTMSIKASISKIKGMDRVSIDGATETFTLESLRMN